MTPEAATFILLMEVCACRKLVKKGLSFLAIANGAAYLLLSSAVIRRDLKVSKKLTDNLFFHH